MTDAPIRHVPMPEYCGECFNQLLRDCTEHPERAYSSLYCGHGRSVITAHLSDRETDDGERERVVYCWSVSGPMSEDQALVALHNTPVMIGATVDYGSTC